MTPELLTIRKSLNKAYLKVKPTRSQIELFKTNISKLYEQIKGTESEEHQKNNIISFLKNTYYDPNNYINTKGRNDLVIHNGKDAKSSVGVIIETKRPGNKTEMPSKESLNAKAVHELILYYLRERITQKNLEIKYLIATDLYEWYIFNAQDFERIFAKNKRLVSDFEKFEEKRLSGTKTDFFYDDIAKPFINEQEFDIPVTWFDLRDYKTVVKNDSREDDKQLIEVYKILSAEHLLKLPFLNDSNTLDKKFYSELLHIIGLEEKKEGSKKLIGRKAESKRDNGSLIENAINILNYEDCLRDIKNPSEYGENKEAQLYHVALELSITWINRVLFLKLLEGQLVRYHNGDTFYKFLNAALIPDYDSLNKLFFHVLAVKEEERGDHVKEKYRKIPYLNSSLFEPNELEHRTIRISNLEDDYTLPILSGTVLKDNNGKKKTGNHNPLNYLFEFLDSYDFSSEGSEDISEENKTLINASVLGLIFEKINGYKDGSFFTPGFITMYMCRETIRRAVVQKFNDAKGWKYENLDDLYSKIDNKKEANEIINSLKICDPAVGSGHFLVSALNEIIAIKSELKILADSKGKVLRDYHVEVINDELVITDEDGKFFEYHPKNPESQRIQETLFHEKQTIIENCLFGVDINQNSVKICRLRLWIELLKNAYYRSDSGFSELETLPNIDINIKCGNSLISRYPLDADIKSALAKSKWTIESYRLAVMSYRNAENKEEKVAMRKLIDEIKSDFESEVSKSDKRFVRLNKLKGVLSSLTGQQNLFEMEGKQKTDWEMKVKKTVYEINILEVELEEIRNNKIYEHAFEWRFEFPEVLNDEGEFVGFHVVIGNPPYVFAREHFNEGEKAYYNSNYEGIDYQINLYVLFIERSIKLLNSIGLFGLIVPNSLLMVSSTVQLRKFILKNTSISEILNFIGETFEGVSVETISIFGGHLKENKSFKVSICENGLIKYLYDKEIDIVFQSNDFALNVFADARTEQLIQKINEKCCLLEDVVDIKAGLQAYEVGKGHPKQSREDVTMRIYDYSYKFDSTTYPYLEGKDVLRYLHKKPSSFLKYGDNLAAPREFNIFSNPKIIVREITGNHPNSLICCYSQETLLFNRSNIAILSKDQDIDLKYVLGFLNSKIISFLFQANTAKANRKMFPKIILKDLRKFPIIRLSNHNQKPLIELVDEIIRKKQLNNKYNTSILEEEINMIIYKSLNLSIEEIEMIEKV